MLQFIVLGQVPGTSFQVTFAWVLFVALLIAITILIKLEFAKIKQLLSRKQAATDQPLQA